MTKRLLVIGTAVMTTLLALVALWQFRIVLIYVLISLVLAATFRPIAQSESKGSFRSRVGLNLQYLAGLAVFGFFIYLIGKFLIGDFQQLAERLSLQSAWVLPSWLEGSLFQETLVAWVPTPDKILGAITSQRQLVLPAILSITEGVGGLLSAFLIILFLSIYWSTNQNHFERLWLSLLPAEQRTHARDSWRTIEHNVGVYARSEIIQSILAVLLLGLGYWLLGSPYPALLAVTGAIAWFIPVVGATLAVILPFLIGLLTSIQLSLFTVLYTLVVLIALEVWVQPRLFKLKSDSPVLTFIILLAMADAFGLTGLILAPPISVICQILWNLLVTNRTASESTVQVSDLKERQARLEATINGMEEPPPPLVVSSMQRLHDLLNKAEPLLQANVSAEPPKPFHPSQPVNEVEKSKFANPVK